MTPRARLALAAILAPLVPPALVMAAATAAAGVPTPAAFVLISGTAYALGLLGLLLFGYPLYRHLRRRDRLSWPPFLLAGLAGGTATLGAAALLVAALLGRSYSLPFGPAQFSWGAAAGLCTAAAFCAIAGIPRRTPRSRARVRD